MTANPIQIEALTSKHRGHLSHILANLRSEDVKELSATGTSLDAVLQAVSFNAQHLPQIAIGHDGVPVFAWGLTRLSWYDTAFLWGFGTNATRRAMPAITRYGKTTWLPEATKTLTRIITVVPTFSTHSIQWLTALGMHQDEVITNHGLDPTQEFVRLARNFDGTDVLHFDAKAATANRHSSTNEVVG